MDAIVGRVMMVAKKIKSLVIDFRLPVWWSDAFLIWYERIVCIFKY